MEQRPSDPELYRTTYRDQIARQPLPRTYVTKADIRTPKPDANASWQKRVASQPVKAWRGMGVEEASRGCVRSKTVEDLTYA